MRWAGRPTISACPLTEPVHSTIIQCVARARRPRRLGSMWTTTAPDPC